MNAHIGDLLIIESTHLAEARRTGVVVALAHPDGSPPYRVRWLDDGRTTLIFPGAEARIQPAVPAGERVTS